MQLLYLGQRCVMTLFTFQVDECSLSFYQNYIQTEHEFLPSDLQAWPRSKVLCRKFAPRGAMKSQRLAASNRSAASLISADDSSRSTSCHSRMKAWRASSSGGALAHSQRPTRGLHL